MREGHIASIRAFVDPGITPAYAGRTSICKCSGLLYRDHPRLCGKDSIQFIIILFSPGSPPLMREGHMDTVKLTDEGGITPAYAGRTKLSGLHVPAEWDHPRLCGKDASKLSKDI